MLKPRIEEALSEQVNRELYSSYLYLSLSVDAAHRGLKGVANWFSVQMREELAHAQKIHDFILSRGGRVHLLPIAQPPAEFDSVLSLFESALAHECELTERINELVTLARAENDHATEILLQWFVSEQVEEEDTAGDIISKLKLAGDRGEGLYLVDQELSNRTFAPE